MEKLKAEGNELGVCILCGYTLYEIKVGTDKKDIEEATLKEVVAYQRRMKGPQETSYKDYEVVMARDCGHYYHRECIANRVGNGLQHWDCWCGWNYGKLKGLFIDGSSLTWQLDFQSGEGTYFI